MFKKSLDYAPPGHRSACVRSQLQSQLPARFPLSSCFFFPLAISDCPPPPTCRGPPVLPSLTPAERPRLPSLSGLRLRQPTPAYGRSERSSPRSAFLTMVPGPSSVRNLVWWRSLLARPLDFFLFFFFEIFQDFLPQAIAPARFLVGVCGGGGFLLGCGFCLGWVVFFFFFFFWVGFPKLFESFLCCRGSRV